MALGLLAIKSLRGPKLCRAEDLRAQDFGVEGADVMHELHNMRWDARGRTQSMGILDQ